jgi:hypothetical protein
MSNIETTLSVQSEGKKRYMVRRGEACSMKEERRRDRDISAM